VRRNDPSFRRSFTRRNQHAPFAQNDDAKRERERQSDKDGERQEHPKFRIALVTKPAPTSTSSEYARTTAILRSDVVALTSGSARRSSSVMVEGAVERSKSRSEGQSLGIVRESVL
jgi:hypothetical protein